MPFIRNLKSILIQQNLDLVNIIFITSKILTVSWDFDVCLRVESLLFQYYKPYSRRHHTTLTKHDMVVSYSH